MAELLCDKFVSGILFAELKLTFKFNLYLELGLLNAVELRLHHHSVIIMTHLTLFIL